MFLSKLCFIYCIYCAVNVIQECHQTTQGTALVKTWADLASETDNNIAEILSAPLWDKQGLYLCPLIQGYNVMLRKVLNLACNKQDAEAINCVMYLKGIKGPRFLNITLDTYTYKKVFMWSDANIFRLESLLDETDEVWTEMEELNYYNKTYNFKVNKQ